MRQGFAYVRTYAHLMTQPAKPLKKHVTISIDAELHRRAQLHAEAKGFDFSELVARLLNAEMASKTGIARRHQPVAEAVA